VVAVGDETIVEIAGPRTLGERRAGGERRHERQHEAHRSVQALELLVVRERKVDVHALEVGPAMTTTVEYRVVRPVDRRPGVRPQPGFVARVHPRVHPGAEQARAVRGEHRIEPLRLVLEGVTSDGQKTSRKGILDLDQVQSKLVGHAELAGDGFLDHFSSEIDEQAVGNRHDVERLAVDDHVLELDAATAECSEARTHAAGSLWVGDQ
jgi:hypothetical protein